MEDPPYLSDWSYANTYPRVKVPETWLWIDAITGPDGKVTIQVTVPDTKTSWVASAFGVSSVAGLGIAASTVNLNNVYETYDASGIDLNVKTTQNGNQITVTICTSWTNKEESGKMVMEVAELTGYDVSNLDDLKNRVQDIKRVEYKNGILFLYFDKLTAVETCVDVISDKVSPASNVKDAPIRVYPYPSRGRTVFYAHPQALSQTSP